MELLQHKQELKRKQRRRMMGFQEKEEDPPMMRLQEYHDALNELEKIGGKRYERATRELELERKRKRHGNQNHGNGILGGK